MLRILPHLVNTATAVSILSGLLFDAFLDDALDGLLLGRCLSRGVFLLTNHVRNRGLSRGTLGYSVVGFAANTEPV